MDTAKLLAEVFASGRLEILKALRQRPHRYTDLTRELDLSEGEVSRHLQRLHQAGLIEKLATGMFQPTPLALVALGFEPGLDLLARRADFFRTHDVHALDQRFLLRLEALSHAEFLTDPIEIFGAITQVRTSVRKRLDGICLIAEHVASGSMTHATFAPIADLVEEHGTQVRLITQQEDVAMSIEYQGVLHPQLRTVAVSRFDLFMSDTHALLNVATREGKVDYATGFFGTDPRFYEWCRDLFEFQWAAATPVPVSQIEATQRALRAPRGRATRDAWDNGNEEITRDVERASARDLRRSSN